jgi:hypothetical protein
VDSSGFNIVVLISAMHELNLNRSSTPSRKLIHKTPSTHSQQLLSKAVTITGIGLAFFLAERHEAYRKRSLNLSRRCDMYFIKSGCQVCHILEDEFDGSAPAPCGVKAEKYDLHQFNEGKPTANIMAVKPADVPLCKHCEKGMALMRTI